MLNRPPQFPGTRASDNADATDARRGTAPASATLRRGRFPDDPLEAFVDSRRAALVPNHGAPAVLHIPRPVPDDPLEALSPPPRSADRVAFAVPLGTVPVAEAVPVAPGDLSLAGAPVFDLQTDATVPVVLDEEGQVLLLHGVLRPRPSP